MILYLVSGVVTARLLINKTLAKLIAVQEFLQICHGDVDNSAFRLLSKGVDDIDGECLTTPLHTPTSKLGMLCLPPLMLK